MHLTTYTLLVYLALVLGVVGTAKPAWPLVGVAIILLSVACLIGKT